MLEPDRIRIIPSVEESPGSDASGAQLRHSLKNCLKTLRMLELSLETQIDDLDQFLTHWHRHSYASGHTIIRAGERSDTLYFILSGSVTVLLEDEDGNEIILAYLNPGEFFGEMGLFEREQGRSALVKAKTTCEIARISYARIQQIAGDQPEVLYAIGAQLAGRLRVTSRRLGDLAFLDVTGRIARALLDLSQQPDALSHPDGMQIRITRQELGRIVGCSREMAGRVIKALEEQELISAKGKTIVVFQTR